MTPQGSCHVGPEFAASESAAADSPRSRNDDEVVASTHCVTCGDVAVEMSVVAIDETRGLALCQDPGGTRETVEVALVAPVALGERLLVHVGTAIGRPGAGP